MGIFKKAVFADSFARVAAYGTHPAGYPSLAEAWLFSIAYALQLYFDFSGYSDMAIGSALMLGIEIPRNFDAPYSSKSIIMSAGAKLGHSAPRERRSAAE
jgi:alginate O-acetyltransferase complex protein AlgI